ncbi:hypothetical protein BG10_892 [Bacillus thuringiensis serovar morrisoni]|uniref:DUF4355 domain-containing protein n=1 Tax=Bacillus thuringiensis TaxID=1428 RepID=UPI0005AF3211|nr:DUF4355 domain-containing protein [Bacillus thuringiensis]KIP26198.1 hypothetical protein BG10_892 [Bacillus thuringiensis serovar morrisoni]MED2074805.1 DUF4355 domain-containing protein [Bacillus thuringiensis]
MKTFTEERKNFRLSIGDLQHFAGDDDPNPDDNKETDHTNNPEDNPNDPPEKTFTQADVDALIAKEKKRAAKRAREEADKEYQRKSMTDEERRQQELEDLKKENESYKTKARRAELKDHATSMLQDAGVPARFASRLIGEDEEATAQAVHEFITDWNSEMSTAVKGKLAGQTPKTPKVEKETTDKVEAAFDAAWNE